MEGYVKNMLCSSSVYFYTHVQVQNCIAFGPGVDMFDSTRIIGENQFHLARVS